MSLSSPPPPLLLSSLSPLQPCSLPRSPFKSPSLPLPPLSSLPLPPPFIFSVGVISHKPDKITILQYNMTAGLMEFTLTENDPDLSKPHFRGGWFGAYSFYINIPGFI